ncbi:MAG: DUF2948 family protein [Alphaproteobacteria bacterium]
MSATETWSPSPPLKLRAEDGEDLAVLSACLQDALVPLGDATYLAEDKQFVLVANRFRWETEGKKRRRLAERVLCGLCFENVVKVRRRGIGQGKRAGFLSLLAIGMSEGGMSEGGMSEGGMSDGDGDTATTTGPSVLLTFSGGAAIRLETTGLLCHLEDLGESWPTSWQPEHPKD